jgi:hypothetical protein
VEETDRIDLCAVFKKGLTDAVHSIHDSAIARKNDGEVEITIQDQAHMIDDVAAGEPSRAFIVPIRLIDLSNR